MLVAGDRHLSNLIGKQNPNTFAERMGVFAFPGVGKGTRFDEYFVGTGETVLHGFELIEEGFFTGILYEVNSRDGLTPSVVFLSETHGHRSREPTLHSQTNKIDIPSR